MHVKYRQKTLFLVLYGQSRLKTSEHEIIVNMTMNLGMKVKACVKVLIRGHSHLILHHLQLFQPSNNFTLHCAAFAFLVVQASSPPK